ncbi:hypothetical protein VTI28DRAFT_3263 [Corynascus sepedonium]
MAFQIGDIIRLSELCWDIYNIGWVPEFPASEQYAAFFADLNGYANNLSILVDVVQRAQQSLVDRGAGPAVHPRWHLESLFDIIGDYETTLHKCHKLIQDNKRFRETTGPIRSLEWFYLVQPRVDSLQERLMRHNARLQLVLKPFEIDLLTRIHDDISRRIGEVGDQVRGVRDDLRELIGILVPNLRDALDMRDHREIHSVEIPSDILTELDVEFKSHPSFAAGGYPSLRNMTDSFIMSFDQCTQHFAPGLTIEQKTPPVFEYISLLKCQFLMQRIRESSELANIAEGSHWPGYINALEEKLSAECYRFRRDLAAPDATSRTGDMITIWPEEEPPPVFDVYGERLQMEDLMDVPLVAEHESHKKTLRLLRHTGSRDRRYRMITTVHVANQELPYRRTVDFDITSAVLNPVYASPSNENAPFEIILEENHNSHIIRFVNREDLFMFQQALTGFQVVDDYAEYMVKASFVVRGLPIVEEASLQLWLPRRLDGDIVSEDSDPQSLPADNGFRRAETLPTVMSRRGSNMSAMSTNWALHRRSIPSRTCSTNTNLNRTSTNLSPGTSSHRRGSIAASTRSSGSDNTTVTVSCISDATSTGIGRIHNQPIRPRVVLFTKDTTGAHALVVINVDEETEPNSERCYCRTKPGVCIITALEQRAGARTLAVHRLAGDRWDVLPLAVPRRRELGQRGFATADWRGVARVSLLFRSVDARIEFGGGWCDCRRRNEGEEIECLKNGHVGLLGQLRVWYRRQMVAWHHARYKSHVEVVRQPRGRT